MIDEDYRQESSATPTTKWIREIDRGGLWHVKDVVFMMFEAMEEEVRKHLQIGRVSDMGKGYRDMVVEKISANNDVSFYWCILSTDICSNDADYVLNTLIEMWVTVRGFSFVNGWIELYKQNKKQNLQRSKSLRKKIT